MRINLFRYTRSYLRLQHRFISHDAVEDSKLCKYLNVNKDVAGHLCIKYPVINKIDEDTFKSLISTVDELGYHKDILINEPQLFAILPVTLRFRHEVLTECGITNVTPKLLTNYLNIVKQKSIEDLKMLGLISSVINVENKLASYMTQWPTSLTSSIWEDVDKLSLYNIRLYIIRRYLELVLDLTEEEFARRIKTYPTLKHRPLAVINETLQILKSQIMMPISKIKSNFYLLHADPENLKNILYKFKSIGGIDVKEVIRMYPKIATKNYKMLIEVRNVLKEYNISPEAQRRCFDIYTLNSNTIKERLEKAKSIPEFNTFLNHPRFLKIIHYNNTAIKRLQKLYENNKKCVSLNVLSGSSAHYETFEKAPGDRLGKVKDLIFCISQSLGNKYKSYEIRNKIRRHPFWINIPLVQVKYVHEKLSNEFSSKDIFENCALLLYPWCNIKDALDNIHKNQSKRILYLPENLNTNQLSKSQKLSLVLYAIEKKHYFTGNGVWAEEKNKVIQCN